MLNINIGFFKDTKYTGDGWFDNVLDYKILLDDFPRRVIKEIDKSDVFDANVIISPI